MKASTSRYKPLSMLPTLSLLVAVLASPGASAQTFSNPIVGETSADPTIVLFNGYYYHAFSVNDLGLAVRKSATLSGLGSAPAVQVWTAPSTGSYSHDIWAPELQFLWGKWYIYFAADDGNNATHRMYVLESTSLDPQGPYVFKGQLRPTTDKFAIDGSVTQKDDGSLYFVWSGWPGDVDGQQSLYIAPMTNPWTINGERTLIAMPTFDWEGRGLTLNEGPEPIRLGSQYGIIYSASASWTQDYTLGLLTNLDGNLLNPKSWVKTGPVFRQNRDVYGPGHCTFTTSPDGTERWIAYHAKRLVTGGWSDRSVRAQKFYLSSDGSLNLGVARSVSIPQPLPAGENGAPHSPDVIDANGWGDSFEGAAKSGTWSVTGPTAASGTSFGASWAQIFRGNANFETVAVSADIQWIATGTTSSFPKFGIYGVYKDTNNNVAAFLDKKFSVLATYAVVGGTAQSWQNTSLPAGFNWSVAHNLRVERSWSGDYKFFLDGVLQQTRNFGNIIGQMGLVTEDTRANYTNVKMDFTQGWGDPARDGYENGSYEIRSARDVVGWGLGAGWKGLWQKTAPTTAGYSVQADARLLATGTTSSFPKYGIYGCYQDGNNYMTAWLDPKYSVLATHVVSGGVDRGWQNTNLSSFTFGNPHTLKVVRSGSTFTVSVDGVQQQTRTAGLTSCQTGLVSEDTQVEYTNFKVY